MATASQILHDFHKLPNYVDTEREQKKIIKAAAELIKRDIKEVPTSKEVYPGSVDITAPTEGVGYCCKSH